VIGVLLCHEFQDIYDFFVVKKKSEKPMILTLAYLKYLPTVGRVATKIIPYLEIESKCETQIDFPVLMSLIWTIDLKA
jgi:hypothetical protein